MTTTIDQLIVDVFAARLALITIANGYTSSAGENLHADNLSSDADLDSFPRLIYGDPTEETLEMYSESTGRNALTLTATMHDKIPDGYIAGSVARRHVGDIKKAVVQGTRRFDGLLFEEVVYAGRIIDLPETGESTVSVEVSFTATYIENIGDPYTVLTNP
ncbi:hypothetical protein [Candidatus Vondammii sp. HM_W22]|uniref:hypothetical protein n=1 Tax=Candidatus Vondammii sp. HM_W22 TaxID=2687299 RepID=UPI002E7ABDDC|nr:hypothetical protein [Candidatus Vondammii sp. HM_W22]